MAEKWFFKPMEKNLEKVFEGSGLNPNAAAATQICHMLEQLDRPMGWKTLLGMFFGQGSSTDELIKTLDHLCMVGRLAKKDIFVDAKLMGTVIGTPQALGRYSDVELVGFLKRAVGPLPDSNTDSSSDRSSTVTARRIDIGFGRLLNPK
jgi:hypothetical protein